MSKEKQFFQVQNIIETLQEATDHFATLVKNKELNQSIFMFSSIIEGCQSVINMLNSIDKQFVEHTTKLEQYLIMIANELENGNFIKIAEIVQFSLKPQFIRLNQTFIETVGNHHKEETISIGVFHSWANPREFYPKERVSAMVKESEKQDAILYFFSSDDVDFKNKQVSADTFNNDSWYHVTVPFPDVINNVGAGRRSHTERKLRREIPFTSFHVGNKYTLPERMVKHRKFVELLVPFKVCNNETIIRDFIEQNHRVVFKALRSNRGENIYFITKKGSRYVMLDQKKERILNEEAFDLFVKNTILGKKGSYIVQRYIDTRTKADEPYHFRAQVQKDGQGNWVLVHIYASIGNKKGNLSNLSTGGYNENLKPFLQKEFGNIKGTEYEKTLLNLSLDVTRHLDHMYGYTLDEIGLDFAIDHTGKIWMHEANNGPQTSFFEEKRAYYKISYAKYIAKKGVMYKDAAAKLAATKGQFLATTSELPLAPTDNRPCIGTLVGKQVNDTYAVALAEEAEANEIALFQFSPKDIDFDRGLIRAFFYENGVWIPKIAEYPDVIIDRLKMRGKKNATFIYEELEDIPFTNEWPVHTTKRSEIYESLHDSEDISKILADYQMVTRPLHVFQFIKKYEKVIVKPVELSSTLSLLSIKQLDNRNYSVTTENKRKEYTENQLRNLINGLITENTLLVQEDGRNTNNIDKLSDLHLHMMKDENNEWSFVSQYVKIEKALEDGTIEAYKEDLSDFIKSNTLQNQINIICVNVASELEEINEIQINEVALVVSLNLVKGIKLLEVDPNGPSNVHDAKQLANASILFAKSLAVKEINLVES